VPSSIAPETDKFQAQPGVEIGMEFAKSMTLTISDSVTPPSCCLSKMFRSLIPIPQKEAQHIVFLEVSIVDVETRIKHAHFTALSVCGYISGCCHLLLVQPPMI
jgi:hypothetical protein